MYTDTVSVLFVMEECWGDLNAYPEGLVNGYVNYVPSVPGSILQPTAFIDLGSLYSLPLRTEKQFIEHVCALISLSDI